MHGRGDTVPDRYAGTRHFPLATPFSRLAREGGTSRGVLVSVALHVAVVLVLLWGGASLALMDRAPGSGQGRGGGGGGGGNRTLLVYVAPPEPTAPPPPIPVTVPVLTAAVISLPEIHLPAVLPTALSQLGAVGPGQGTGQGSGTGPGTGTGSGGGTGSGQGIGVGSDSGGGGRYYPPSPRTVLLPPQRVPRALHGGTITADFDISALGEVTRVRLDPEPRDSQFAADFIAKLRQYLFTPARTLDGRPVAARLSVVFTLR
jgi:hypothetical protein